MAFLWGGTPAQTEFDTLLEKTTSDTLPSSTPVDLSLSLQLADLIRSASVAPPVASKALLKRLQNSNPNVQLLALQVLDVCIKNGGTPFLVQISEKDKEFYQALETLARGGGNATNRDVKDKTLEKLQEWAVAFKGKDQLRDSGLVRVYERMKNEGLPFPAKDPLATAAMVDSLSAPEWQDSTYCTRCRTDFSTFNRKHHCRNCGLVFDQACSAQTSTLPHYGITQQVRVCDGCSKKIKDGKGAEVARNQSVKSSASSGKGGHERSKSRKEQEDEDLRKAIEASLKESSETASHGPLRDPPPNNSGYNPSYASNFGGGGGGSDSKKPLADGRRAGGDEEDADLAAAIAASLRDIAPPPTAPTFGRQDSSSQPVTYSEMFPTSSRPTFDSQDSSYSSTTHGTNRPQRISLPSYDLVPTQISSLNQFTSTFTPHHPGPSYLTAREHDLANEVVRDVQPRLERSLEDTKRRKEILKELEWKLGEAARLYGAGLTEQNQVYRSPSLSRREEQTYRQTEYNPHYAPTTASPTMTNPQYQYQPSSVLVGQPLPNYAVPPQREQQVHYEPPPQEYYSNRQPEEGASNPRTAAAKQQQVAGYYKPSSFPSVPLTNPHSLESLPHVPEQDPWKRERAQDEEAEEPAKVGELIEF